MLWNLSGDCCMFFQKNPIAEANICLMTIFGLEALILGVAISPAIMSNGESK